MVNSPSQVISKKVPVEIQEDNHVIAHQIANPSAAIKTIKVMKATQFIISVFVLLTASTTWAKVKINEKNFPDANFRAWVLEQEYGKDGVLTAEEIAGIDTIVIQDLKIQSLKGVEYFTALTKLNCGDNQLTALDVSKNTKLTDLGCFNNQLTSLDVSKNTALTELGHCCNAAKGQKIEIGHCCKAALSPNMEMGVRCKAALRPNMEIGVCCNAAPVSNMKITGCCKPTTTKTN